MYLAKQGVPQDFKEAFKWFHLAAEQGQANAPFFLGGMYDLGYGVTQDYVLAHMWFNIAGSKGDKNAVKLRNSVEKKNDSITNRKSTRNGKKLGTNF